MTSFPSTELDLPFEFEIVGYVSTGIRRYVTIVRDHPYHEYCTFMIGEMRNETGKHPCYHGGYFDKRADALPDMFSRMSAITSLDKLRG